MRPDISDLEGFYATRQGLLARRLIGHRLRQLWPDVGGAVVLGVGYATPFLAGLDADRPLAVMPAAQGVTRWPSTGRSRVALGRDDQLPLPDRSVDRILLAHAIECSPQPKRLLREVWRVMADDARVAILVPNRRGLWCWSERTPFGYGQPYSASQLSRLLRASLLEPRAERGALYLPPTDWRLAQRLAMPIERLGLATAPHFAGVLLVEAEKRIMLAPSVAKRSRRRLVASPQPALAGVERSIVPFDCPLAAQLGPALPMERPTP